MDYVLNKTDHMGIFYKSENVNDLLLVFWKNYYGIRIL